MKGKGTENYIRHKGNMKIVSFAKSLTKQITAELDRICISNNEGLFWAEIICANNITKRCDLEKTRVAAEIG